MLGEKLCLMHIYVNGAFAPAGVNCCIAAKENQNEFSLFPFSTNIFLKVE